MIISVTGLGYVGLPVALAFARHFQVIGFDLNEKRVQELQQKIDRNKDTLPEDFENVNITFTSQSGDLAAAQFHIVAVPTSIDNHQIPNLNPLRTASENIGKILKKGDYVVYESTVYPSCTETFCLPILQQHSGLQVGKDFKLGYSPERINPGDRTHTLQNVTKIVAGSDTEALATISSVYSRVVQAGLCEVSSIQVAEAAKILENTQRDLNIALMNEMAMICHQLDINTQEVIDAAATKWNFLRFTPGLVGGHCIGIDPYYMTYKAKEIGYEPRVILSGRQINDSMGRYIAQQVIQQLVKMGKVITTAKVLVMGVTFKENISDTRNSKVIDIIKTLQTFNVQIDITDPHALPDLLEKEYQLTLTAELSNDYDAVIVAVPHQAYLKLTEEDLLKYAKENALLVDVKNIFKNKIQKMAYWSL